MIVSVIQLSAGMLAAGATIVAQLLKEILTAKGQIRKFSLSEKSSSLYI
jgi:hypothetical protein